MHTVSLFLLMVIAAAIVVQLIQGGATAAKRWIGKRLTGTDVFGA